MSYLLGNHIIGFPTRWLTCCSYRKAAFLTWRNKGADQNVLKFAGKFLSMFPLVHRPGLNVIKLFSCSAQLRLKFILLINVKMPTIVGILTFISRINY